MRWRETGWLALAVGIHGLAFAISAWTPGAPHEPESPAQASDVEIALDDSTLQAIAESNLREEVAPVAGPHDERRARPAAAGAPAAVSSSEDMPSSDPAASTTAGSPSAIPFAEPSASTGLRALSNDALGLGTRNALVGHGLDLGGNGGRDKAGESGPNMAPGIQASLLDGIHEHDVELGLGAGGVLVGPAEEIARASETPWNSTATFEIVADATGAITAVRLVDVSEAWGSWEHVSTGLLDAIRARKIKLHPRGNGIVVTLQVASRRALPSGAPATASVRAGDTGELRRGLREAIEGTKPAASSSPEPAPTTQQVELLKVNPKVEDAIPKTDTAINVGVPSQRARTADVVSVPFDVVDFGARPQRSVHARVLREKTL